MRRELARRMLLGSALALGLATSAQATVIFSNLGPGDSFNSSALQAVAGPSSYGVEKAMPFVPISGEFFLDKVELAVRYNSGAPNTLTLCIMADDAGAPGTILETLQIGPLSSELSVVMVDSVTRPVLTGGAQYWLGASADADAYFGWAFNDTGDVGQAWRYSEGAWEVLPTNAGKGAFRIQATVVPEPSTALLFTLGLVMLAAGRSTPQRARRPPAHDPRNT